MKWHLLGLNGSAETWRIVSLSESRSKDTCHLMDLGVRGWEGDKGGGKCARSEKNTQSWVEWKKVSSSSLSSFPYWKVSAVMPDKSSMHRLQWRGLHMEIAWLGIRLRVTAWLAREAESLIVTPFSTAVQGCAQSLVWGGQLASVRPARSILVSAYGLA